MAKYHGTRIPKGLDRSLRKTLEAHERALRRGSASLTLADTNNNEGSGVTAQKTLGGLGNYIEYGLGSLASLPSPLRGTELTLRFLGVTEVSNLGNLRLPAGGFTSEPGTILKLVADGDGLLHQVSSTAPGNERTFVPVRKWHLTPNTGDDLTTQAQSMFDDPASAGVVLVFEKGDYIINGVTITQSDTNIFLPPGCRIYTTASTPRAVFNVAGTIDTAAATNVIKNPDANDNEYPRGGERTIYVASGAGAGFPVDSWFSIEDEEDVPPPGRWGGDSDPNYLLEHHMELCRVKAMTPGGSGDRIDLWFPLVNSYAFIGIAPRLRTVVPVTNFKIWGGGTIQNHTTPTGSNASHGLVCAYAVGVTIENVRFSDVFDSCIHLLRCQDFRVTACEWRDPPRFDSHGYGITTYGGIRGTIQGNVARRLRHGIDISFFSRIVTVDGNSLAGSTTGNLNTHPCVEGITFSNNVIDGAYSQEQSSNSVEYGENVAAPIASGIDIDEHVRNATVIGNTVRNCRRAGIFVDMGHSGFPTEFITIIGNTFENCGTAQRLNHPPTSYPDVACIQLLEQWAGGNTRRGIVCKGNTVLNPGQYGIVSDITGVIIEGNWIARPASQTQLSDTPAVGIGIWVRGGATADCLNPMVKNNVIDNPVQQGIRVGKDLATFKVIGAVIEGNTTRNGTGAGIFLEETAPHAIVRNNWSEGNTGTNVDGINTQSTNGLFEGNTLLANTSYGIRLIGGADKNILRNNIYSRVGYTDNGLGEILDAGAGNVTGFVEGARISAMQWNAYPQTGTDMSAKLNDAFTKCPLGATLVIEKGTYTCNAPLVCSRAINVDATGAVFDFGTTVLASPAITYGIDGSPRMQERWWKGGTVQRTYGAGPALYDGFVALAPVQCRIEDLIVSGFEDGIFLKGGTARGAAYNTFINCKTQSCKYHVRLNQGAAGGWCNENAFIGLRFLQNIADATQALAMRLVWIEDQAAGAVSPNHNRFIDCTFEPGANPLDRIARVEGAVNHFISCRWEDSTITAIPIQIGGAARTSASYGGNVFMYGHDLDTITADPTKVQFTDSAANTANNRNEFHTKGATHLAGGGGSPQQVLTLANVSSSANEALSLLTSAGWPNAGAPQRRLAMRAGNATAGRLATIDLYNSSGSTLLNSLYGLSASIGGAVGTQIGHLNGISVNEALADSDSQISGDNVAALTYWDASTDRVGIGTNVPGGRFTLRLGTSPEPALYWRVGATATEVLWASQQSDVWDSATGYGWSCIQDEVSTGDIFIRRHAGAGPLTAFQWGRAGNFGYGGAKDSVFAHKFTGGGLFTEGLNVNFGGGTDTVLNSFRFWSTNFPSGGGTPLVYYDANSEAILYGGASAAFDGPYSRIAVKAKNNSDKAGVFIDSSANDGARDTLAIWIGGSNSPASGAGNFGWRVDLDGAVDGDLRIVANDGGTFRRALRFERSTGRCRMPFRLAVGADATAGYTLDVTGIVNASSDGYIGGLFGVGTQTPQIKAHVLRKESPNNTVLECLRLQRDYDAGGGAAGIGVRLGLWVESATDGTAIAAGQLDAVLDVATLASADSTLRFFAYDGGTQKEIVRMEGATPQLILHNNAVGSPEFFFNYATGGVVLNEQGRAGDFRVEVSGAGNANMLLVQDQAGGAGRVGIRQSAPAETLHVTGNIRADTSLMAGGDRGSGVTGFTTLTNVTQVAGGGASTATFVANAINGTGLPATAAQWGWAKIYDGTSVGYVPVWR